MVAADHDDAGFARLCELCDVAPGGDPRPAVEARVVEQLRAGPTAKWADLLADAGVPAAVVTTDLAALHSDPRFEAMFEPLSQRCFAPAAPWRLAS